MIDLTNAYLYTLPVVGTENLIMAATLILMARAKKQPDKCSKLSIYFFAMAMLLMAIINYAETITPPHASVLPTSMAIIVFAASAELFLFFFAFIALLDERFVTKRRVAAEVALIALFTLPPLFCPDNTAAYGILFATSVLFYLCKFSYNLYIYKRYFRAAYQKMLDFYSDQRKEQIQWINNLFYAVIMIGTLSVIVPLTNYTVLFFYNLFLFFAYFYVFIEVVRHEFVWPATGREEPADEPAADEPGRPAGATPADVPPTGFLTNREDLLEQWLASRAYTRPRITVDDVARELRSSRAKLSGYLNSELHLNFYEWISRLRMEEAKRLLRENPVSPILDIATQVGIDDRSNFDRNFKRIVGMSAAAYRKSAFNTAPEADHTDGSSG